VRALVESGFAGPPPEQVLQQAAILGRAEHEADKIQDQCAKVLFKEEDSMPPAAVFMWTKVLNKIGADRRNKGGLGCTATRHNN